MKNYFLCLIPITFILFSCHTTKQNKSVPVNSLNGDIEVIKKKELQDTFNYLQSNIVNNKEKYIGQPLSKLLSDLPYNVASYLIGLSQYRQYSEYLSLSFVSKKSTSENIMKDTYPVLLHIHWQTLLPHDILKAMRIKDDGAWLDTEKQYYGKQIVKDIEVSGK